MPIQAWGRGKTVKALKKKLVLTFQQIASCGEVSKIIFQKEFLCRIC